jgi:polysaccharide export outer membrane protein
MVPHAGVIYVVGAVNKPGGFTMKPSSHGMTVLQALALAEDTRSTALKDQTVIIRNDAQSPGGRKQIPVELKKVLRGKTPDPVLQADDILFVPDSAGKRALHRSMEAIVQATTGLAIVTPRL